jgi:tetratricopeptide (TPR) repeat protein
LHLGVIIVASLNIIAGFLPLLASAKAARRITYAVSSAVVVILMFVTAPPHLFRDLFQEQHPNADILVYKEGKVANVLVYDFKKLGYKDFHLNAVNEASSRLWHVQLFKMLGILPTLVHDHPTDALMVAFGAGMSAGATATNVESLDVVDLNPDIQGVAAAYTRENLDVINQPNFHQIVNDGRNALMLSDKQYSLIISDATNPKMFDSWTLYSKEFYETVKSRLKPGGVFCQWALIPLPADAINVLLNTFRSVFPHISFWVIHGSSQVLMLGTPERLEFDYYELAKRLEPLYQKTDLAEFGIDSPEKFLSFFMLGEDGVEQMLKGYDKISTDDLPHAQFHITQDEEGYDNCLDLVRYQESIARYMKEPENLPDSFFTKMAALEDIGRRLDLAFLTRENNRFAEAEVVADEAHLYDANVAHHLNHCPEKKRHFERRLETHPDDATAHNWLGNICMLDQEYDRALEQLHLALELEPDHAYARMNLAMTLVEVGRYDEAVQTLLDLTHRNPNRPIQRTASTLLKRIRLLRELEFTPNDAQLHRSLGLLYFNDGEPLRAIEEYRKSIRLGDESGETLYNLARIYEKIELVNEAADAYSELAKRLPDNIEVAQKGLFFTTLENNPDQKRDWLNQHIVIPDLTPVTSDHPATCDEALELWRGEDPEMMVDTATLIKVAALFDESTRSKPDDLHAYIEAATIYESIGQYDQAKEDWLGAFKQKPDLKVYETNARRADILKSLTTVDQASLVRYQLLLELAYTYQQAGSFERAMSALQDASRIDSTNSALKLRMAETALMTGQFEMALNLARQIKSDSSEYSQAKKIENYLADLKK